ncbi:MAG: hypothetical protein WC956_00455, partial [bacterium]
MKLTVNTAQMVVIWYATIITVFFIGLALEGWGLLISVVLLAAVLVFSLSGHPEVCKKKAIILISALPVIGVAALLIYFKIYLPEKYWWEGDWYYPTAGGECYEVHFSATYISIPYCNDGSLVKIEGGNGPHISCASYNYNRGDNRVFKLSKAVPYENIPVEDSKSTRKKQEIDTSTVQIDPWTIIPIGDTMYLIGGSDDITEF